MGSFTGWTMQDLEPAEEVLGLYHLDIIMGDSGQETFQVVLDNDPDMALYPEKENCTSKLAKILGPGPPPSQAYSWVMKGTAGVNYRLELFKPAGSVSVTWYKIVEKDEVEETAGAITDKEEEERLLKLKETEI